MVAPFLVLSLRRCWLKPLTSSTGLDLRPGPCQSRGDSHFNYLVSCPPILVLPTHLLLWFPVSWCLPVVFTCSWNPFAHLREAWAPPLPGDRPPQPSSLRYPAVPEPFRPPAPPPISFPIDPIPVRWSWWGALLERNHTGFCHCMVCVYCKT